MQKLLRSSFIARQGVLGGSRKVSPASREMQRGFFEWLISYVLPAKAQPMPVRPWQVLPGCLDSRQLARGFFPGHDGLSEAFAQCEVKGRCGAIRRGGVVEQA